VKSLPEDRVADRENAISACVVVRNEEAVVGRCLDSLDGVVDEIVLVHDGECDDRTLEIAERHGCRIFVRPLVGHAEVATIFAYEQARGEWILTIDADEYLSEPLRRELPALATEEGVNGYEFLWPIWHRGRHASSKGPFRLSLFRRSRVHVLGMMHAVERVDPPVRRLFLVLEHRPLYDNYALRTMLKKQRRWARINAREFVGDLADLPRFNWDGPVAWPRRRTLLNRFSPLLVLPYFPVVLAVALVRASPYASPRVNLRLAFSQALYASMVQFYVAKYLYFGAGEGDRYAASEPPRPSAVRREG
jgi:glycosyltransferase involved in cell wall biosynthesis